MDYLTKARRSEVMANVKGKNTGLEKAMFALLRYEKVKFKRHVRSLPGKPDIVFPVQKIAVFIDGDFWHGYKYRVWGTRLKPFWRSKIEMNIRRDRSNFAKLKKLGWTVLRIWGHEVKKRPEIALLKILFLLESRS